MYNEKEFLKLVKNTKGVDLLYYNNGIFVIQVSNFKACNKLFNMNSIDWCIANNEFHWDEYVKEPNNQQYFIVDFNVIDSEYSEKYNNKAFIGFTIDKSNKIYAAHARNDRNLLRTVAYSDETYFDAWLKEKNLYDFVINQKMSHKNIRNTEILENSYTSMVPVYFLIGSILLAMMTLFIR